MRWPETQKGISGFRFPHEPFRDCELLSAVREALERSRLIVARKVEKQAILRYYGSLSLRQKQVMALVASGLLNKAGRRETRHQRNHSESAPGPDDAENASKLSR
jgi:FixJ family two-component response regulator